MAERDTANPHAGALGQAAEWFAIFASDSVTEADHRRWQQWLADSAANREAWAQVERLDGELRAVAGEPAREALSAAGRSRRRFLGGLAGAAMALPAGWLAWRALPTEAWHADLHTAVGEIRHSTLADGTQLWLNTGSAADLAYDTDRRAVHLLAGEVLIRTAPDARPFELHTPYGTAAPTGTEFSVRLHDADARVAVTAGRVQVAPRQPKHALATLEPGEAVRFDARQVSKTEAFSADNTAWRRGILVADNRPLGRFLDELARYRHGVIHYDDDVAALKLVGAFPLDDTDRVLRALEDSLPVTVTRLTPWWVSVTGRDD